MTSGIFNVRSVGSSTSSLQWEETSNIMTTYTQVLMFFLDMGGWKIPPEIASRATIITETTFTWPKKIC